MTMTARRRLISAFIAAIVAAAPSARAAGLKAGVATLLETGAKRTPSAVAEGRALYGELKRVEERNTRLDYAYAVVLLDQRRHPDAIDLLSGYLDETRDLRAWQVKIWAQLQARQYAAALESAEALADQLPQTPDGPRADDLVITEFLGTVFGYLQLARPPGVDVGRLAEAKNRLLARLGDPYLAALDRGHQRASNKLAQLNQDDEARQQRAKSQSRERQLRDQSAADEHRDLSAAERAWVRRNNEQMKDAQHKLSVLQAQMSSLEKDRIQLNTRIVAAQTMIDNLVRPPIQVRRAESVVTNRTGAPRQGNLYLGERVTSTFAIANEDYLRAQAMSAALAALRRQAFDIDRKMLELRSQAAQLDDQGQAASQAIAESQEVAADADKRAQALERRLDRERSKAAKAQRAAKPKPRTIPFSDFVPFPYEQEKARVLAWFAE
jgi:hypothetical protein